MSVELLTPDAAIRNISGGACVGVGGSINAGHPMALVRALVRARTSELTLVGLTAGLELDLLIAAGACRRLVAAYVGAERFVSLPPALRWAAEEDRIEIWENEEGVHLASLRAKAQRLPFTTWIGAVGTSVTTHPLVESAVDEPSGRTYLRVRPLEVDVALAWAEAADEDGNILLWGPDLGDEALRAAADLRIVQVERIVSTDVLARTPDRVVPWGADVVVRSPLGTHPFSSSTLRLDSAWLTEYAKTITDARKAGERGRVEAYLDATIRNVDGEDGYLEQIGVRRLRSLMC
jgi:acyl CoA:acetate/3-ketoacid CoA transferase alpha subunit